METKDQLMAEIEAYVDTEGLITVIDMLSDIASEKADHIRASYNDKALAKVWDWAAKELNKTSAKLTGFNNLL